MNNKLILGGALSTVVAISGLAGMVTAQSAAETTGLTEEQILEIALAEVPGEVIDIEKERDDGMMIYEVEILTAEGTEMEVEIAAATGEILEVEAEEDRDDDHDKACDDDEGDREDDAA